MAKPPGPDYSIDSERLELLHNISMVEKLPVCNLATTRPLFSYLFFLYYQGLEDNEILQWLVMAWCTIEIYPSVVKANDVFRSGTSPHFLNPHSLLRETIYAPCEY